MGILGEITTKYFDEYVPRDRMANVEYRREMLLLASGDRAAAKQMKLMCSEDPLFYINTFCYTYSPKDSLYGDPRTPFNLYDFQNEVVLGLLGCISDGNDCAVPKSRGVGASWMGLTVLEWCWHFREFLSFLMVSRKESLVDDSGSQDALFQKIDFLHRYQPSWLLPTGRDKGRADPGRKLLHLVNADNESSIIGESTTGNIGVGGRHTAIFFDEFALMEQGYSALTGSRDVTNCRIFNSTPRGQNHFYEVCEKVASKVFRLHWSRHDIFSRGLYTRNEKGDVVLLDEFRGYVRVREKGEKEAKKVLYPDDYPFKSCVRFSKRSPWFDWECTRCSSEKEIAQELEIDFLGSDYQFFDAETIIILKKEYCREPFLVGDLEYDPVTFEPKRFTERSSGRLQLWLLLDDDCRVAKDRKFIIGNDVSAGTGASNSCSCVVDRETGEKVGLWKDSNTLPHPFTMQVIALAKFFNNAHVIWDASGPTGKVFADTITKHGYGDIYYRRNEKRIGKPITDEPGYFLNPTAKTVLLEEYRNSLSSHKFINRSASGMDECLQFIRKADGSIEHSASINAVDPSGARTAHGDEVIADALASLVLTNIVSMSDNREVETPYGCLAWRRRQRENELVASKKDVLGGEW